ncbi:MAG: ABC transporter substrate-binding protein, partial [Gammaproteobacteria bacterium]
MTKEFTGREPELSRRQFLTTTGGAVAGAAAMGLAGQAQAGEPKPGRGGRVRFGTRSDARGLDPHRNSMYYVSFPLTLTTQGLLDLNTQLEPVPGIATEWAASKDLLTYTFKLRKGVLFHNGREVDAAAVKWNYERIQDPKVGNGFARSALANVKETVAVDKYTVRLDLHQPSAVLPADVTFYPCNLMAPDSAAQADTHPIGCGPFKFVKWERFAVTMLERFENYFETDAQGNALPYLSAVEGRPKRADRVRLTALRSGQVDLIDNMAYSDAAEFPQKYAGVYQTWDAPSLGTSHLTFNTAGNGPFSNRTPDGKILRTAAAHATDHEAIHKAVFYERGDIATGLYAKNSPWHAAGARPWPEYDPEKAKFLLKKVRAVGIPVELMANSSWPYMQQTGELLQAMWSEVGFKVNYNIFDAPVIRQKRRTGEFHCDSEALAYRFDPDGFYSREVHSQGPTTMQQSRFHNARADKLIEEARRTRGKKKRLELYAEIDSLVNEELPQLYIHALTLLEAGVMNLKNYHPAISGSAHIKGAG